MENKQEYMEEIKSIKKIMEESSRFLSLSGLSGIVAGTTAIIGGIIAQILVVNSSTGIIDQILSGLALNENNDLGLKLIIDAFAVLLIATGSALFFSIRATGRKGLKIWTPISKRLLLNLLIPLITGGLFILFLYFDRNWQLIVPSMLIFYGLALVNAGKFTYGEVFYLGIAEIVTGLVSLLFNDYQIIIWCFGFGVLHICYGLFMYRKYEV